MMQRVTLLCGKILLATLATAPIYAQEGIRISGRIIDPTTNTGVAGIAVSVYDQSAELIGRMKESSEEGSYSFRCKAAANRIDVYFYDPRSAERGFMYGPMELKSLSGQQDTVLNPAVPPSSNDTASQSRERMSALASVLPRLDLADRLWATKYVAETVRDLRKNKAGGFGKELDLVVRSLQAEKDQFTVLRGEAWLTDTRRHTFQKWPIPAGLDKPLEVTVNAPFIQLEIPKLAEDKSFEFVVSGEMFVALHNRATTTGRLESVYGYIDPQKPRQEVNSWRRFNPGDTTAASGVEKQSLLVRGTSEGSVVVTDLMKSKDPATFDVGATPVGVTALSRDGKMFAAATIDGLYKVWKVKPGDGALDAELVQEGRISRNFPNSMSLAPDLKTLVIGTGLNSFDGGLVIIDLHDKASFDPIVLQSPSAITKIEFGPDSEKILAASANGEMSLIEIENRLDSGIRLDKSRVNSAEVLAFAITPNGETVILKVKGSKHPIALPTVVLFDSENDPITAGSNRDNPETR